MLRAESHAPAKGSARAATHMESRPEVSARSINHPRLLGLAVPDAPTIARNHPHVKPRHSAEPSNPVARGPSAALRSCRPAPGLLPAMYPRLPAWPAPGPLWPESRGSGSSPAGSHRAGPRRNRTATGATGYHRKESVCLSLPLPATAGRLAALRLQVFDLLRRPL